MLYTNSAVEACRFALGVVDRPKNIQGSSSIHEVVSSQTISGALVAGETTQQRHLLESDMMMFSECPCLNYMWFVAISQR